MKQQIARACFYYITETFKTLSDNRKWLFAIIILKLCLFSSPRLAQYSIYTRLDLTCGQFISRKRLTQQ